MRVLLVCERSGGHIFPALAFGKKIRKSGLEPADRNTEVYFFATSPFLKKYIEKESFAVFGKSFSSRNLVREGFWRFFEALYLLFKLKPDKVIGFGGRDSFFLILFSSLLFLDTSIYDPNLKLGRANKILSFFVRKVLRGFAVEAKGKKTEVVGVPLRDNIKKVDRLAARRELGFSSQPVVFCFGGSQGSYFLNRVFIEFMQRFKGDFQVIHLTGRDGYLEIMQLYNKMGIKKFIKDFYYRMEVLYSAADIVVSRSGANTLGEISNYGLASVLIPHPQPSGHQKENALHFKKRQAAFVHFQDEFSFENFSNSLNKLIYDVDLRGELKKKAGGIKLGVDFEEFCNRADF